MNTILNCHIVCQCGGYVQSCTECKCNIYVVIIINMYIFTTFLVKVVTCIYIYLSKVFNYILVKVFTFVNTDDS